MDHNLWHGIGRLTRPPEYVPAGKKGEGHCKFTLAINRVVSNAQGPQADYIPCVLWGEKALHFIEERDKGDEVGIVGSIHTSNVPQADGSTRFYWEVRVNKVSYGRKSLKNLQPKPEPTHTTQALGKLTTEFKG